MTVIVISEECHGDIGIAKDFESAKDFLLNHNWIDEFTEIIDNVYMGWNYICNTLGDDWEEKVKNMTQKEFEKTFEGRIYLQEIEVYGT